MEPTTAQWWVSVVSALGLPLICGALIVMSLLRCSLNRAALLWSLAAGHFVGLALTAGLMALFRLAGLSDQVLPLTAGSLWLLGAMAGAALVLRHGVRQPSDGVLAAPGSYSHLAMSRMPQALWWLLGLWIAAIGLMVVSEVLMRPTYPWDAWSAWSVKARVWADLGPNIDFVSFPRWVEAASAEVFTNEAWNYPETLPLIQLWMSGWQRDWDPAAANLPWASCGLALALLIYQSARMLALGPLAAMISTFFLCSLPILITQLALAGYADIWVCAGLLLFVACLQGQLEGWISPLASWLALALVLSLKLEGVVWAMIGVATLMAAYLSARGRWWLAGVAVLAFVLWWLSGGFSFELGSMAVSVTPQVIELPYLGRYPLGFDNQFGSMFSAFVELPNWHMLWLFGVPAAAMAIWPNRGQAQGRGLAVFLALGLGFLFVLFFCTQAAVWAETMTASNRLALHLVPAAGLWTAVLLGRQLSSR